MSHFGPVLGDMEDQAGILSAALWPSKFLGFQPRKNYFPIISKLNFVPVFLN